MAVLTKSVRKDLAERLYYILTENKQVVSVDNLEEWANWFENSSTRFLKQDEVEVNGKKRYISTVFLGIDHGNPAHRGDEDYVPVLFETMVFTTEGDGEECVRSKTLLEALDVHNEFLTSLRNQ